MNPFLQWAAYKAKPAPPPPRKRRTTERKALKASAGDRFGQWLLLEYRSGTAQPKVHCQWLCQCDCGVQRWVKASNLYNGTSADCGHDNENVRARWAYKNVIPKVRT